jgi:hypothetical protein
MSNHSDEDRCTEGIMISENSIIASEKCRENPHGIGLPFFDAYLASFDAYRKEFQKILFLFFI